MARPLSATDEDILNAAQNVLSRRGLTGFSISEVAREIGLSRTAISLRFESVDNLKGRAAKRLSKSFEDKLAAVTVAPGAQGLLTIANFIGGHIASREGFANYMIRNTIEIQNPDEREKHTSRGFALREVIERAMPPTAIAKEDAVNAFAAHLSGSLLNWQATDGPTAQDFLRERTLNWLRLAGIDVGNI